MTAIQMIIDKEWGLAGNENPLQGSFVLDELADLVEEAVLAEFDRISERGGILDAMETGYQRGKIQDESMPYEHRKHDGSLPLVGVNAFTDPARTAPRPRRSSWPGPARPKAEPAGPAGRFSGQARRDRPGRAAPPQGGGGGGRTERLRGP